MLIGAALYYFIAPLLSPRKRSTEQYLYVEQVFLYSIEKQDSIAQLDLGNKVDLISRQITMPKANLSELSRSLLETNVNAKLRDNQIRAAKQYWGNSYNSLVGTDGGGTVPKPRVPQPPNPPGPCSGGCHWDFIIKPREPLILYSKNPVDVKLLNANGQEIVNSLAGSASQVTKGGFTKIILNLPENTANTNAQLTIDSKLGGQFGKADLNVAIQ
jgi:hypothetical protein